MAVVPRDIDLVVETGEDAEKLGKALSDWLVEPVQRSEGWVARWFGRAFKAARIEWVGEVEAWVDRPEPSDFGPVARRNLRWPVGVESRYGFHFLELQLRVSERRGLIERANRIRETMATTSPVS